MKTEIPIQAIADLTAKQLNSWFGISESEESLIRSAVGGVFNTLEDNFSANPNKYYSRNGETYFNPFHSGQYCIYLYFLSRAVYDAGNSVLADKIYYLNKIMNGLDMLYAINLPKHFTLDHPVGTVLGRANYGEGFHFAQNCTVGNNKGVYPVLGKNFIMCANSTVLGNCHIGDNVILGAGALVKDQDIPSDSLVFGQSPNLIIKSKKK